MSCKNAIKWNPNLSSIHTRCCFFIHIDSAVVMQLNAWSFMFTPEMTSSGIFLETELKLLFFKQSISKCHTDISQYLVSTNCLWWVRFSVKFFTIYESRKSICLHIKFSICPGAWASLEVETWKILSMGHCVSSIFDNSRKSKSQLQAFIAISQYPHPCARPSHVAKVLASGPTSGVPQQWKSDVHVKS